jgi:hypothetical protein
MIGLYREQRCLRASARPSRGVFHDHYSERAVVIFRRGILPIPGTVTTPTTKINTSAGRQPLSAHSATVTNHHVVTQNDGQHRPRVRRKVEVPIVH